MLKLAVLCLVLVLGVATAQIIPNEYIIQFKDDTPLKIREMHMQNISTLGVFAQTGCTIKDRWEIGSFSGYSANIYSQEVLKHIAASYDVLIVEPNQIVTKQLCATQAYSKGLWGLNRISTVPILPIDGYKYNDKGGEGVDNYVIDTGILVSHTDFGGRAKQGISYVSGESTSIDLNGHGTHCAGTIGGSQYGIAKKSTLIAVKVLGKDGSGTLNGIINGCNWVAGQVKSSRRPSTANLSLGAGLSTTVNNAVNSLFDAGVFVAVAAGNSNANACNYSPASATKPVCVGATDSSDILASFSNWGTCVDVLAPGRDILSAWIGSNTATATISGTSMASPHVAGVAAGYLGLHPSATPTQVRTWLLARGINVNISDRRGSPDRLLHQGCY
eukprot:TRINITY_DN22971_c0_g1_i1.p1 TRINITY_DN22971_c0_g1~~TRINITY_DN22971_c0_g1_i1.p1  ORF type:complete len:388 (-),score=89.63 TRINITY_DN22971_c0_g1_i1:38-1201(-)